MANQFVPVDIDFPTNYPGSTEIPLPSGLLQDLNLSITHLLESNLRGSIQGWAWSGARVLTAAAPSTLVPIKNHAGSSGYRNPVTVSNLFDFSTVGLQLNGQVATNTRMQPVVIAIPYYFPDSTSIGLQTLSVDLTMGVYNTSTAGMGVSLGYVAWDEDGNRIYEEPSDFADFCDRTATTPIFELNPDFEFNDRTKYIEAVTDISSDIRLINLNMACRATKAHGYVLISMVSRPASITVTGGEELTRGTDWSWITQDNTVYDANHVRLLRSNSAGNLFDYETLFTVNSSSTVGTTGAKRPWMLQFIRPLAGLGTVPVVSYHSLLHLRPFLNLSSVEWSYGSSTACFHPNINLQVADNLARLEAPGWELSIFPMAYAIISSVFIKTKATNVRQPDQEPLGTGMPATASSYNLIVSNLNRVAQTQGSSSPCAQRVKGKETLGSLGNTPILEKNEVFPWLRYNKFESYGDSVPGELIPIDYSSYTFEGWNDMAGIGLADVTTPFFRRVETIEPIYSLEVELDGLNQLNPLRLNYGVQVGLEGQDGYFVENDKTIDTIPLDPNNFLSYTASTGVLFEQALRGGSFNPSSLADRFCNFYLAFQPEYYRIRVMYPIIDSSGSNALRFSGAMNNFTTGGALDYSTLQLVFPIDLITGSIEVVDTYSSSGIVPRGSFSITGLSPDSPGLNILDDDQIITFYGFTRSPVFKQDPS
jgi:hypothetical protein